MISLHRPPPGNELKSYRIRDVLAHLKQEGQYERNGIQGFYRVHLLQR